MESTLWYAEVRGVSSISGDIQLLLRHKLLLGATPCSAKGAGISRGFWPQASSPRPGVGAYGRKINQAQQRNLTSSGQNQGLAWSSDSSLWGNQVQKRNLIGFGTEPRHCMVLGPKLMGKPTTWMRKPGFGQNQGITWSSDPSQWGNQLLG